MTTVTMPTTPRPPLEEQLRVLRAAIDEDLHPDATWYILPARWFMLLEHLADPATRPRPPNGGPSSLDDLATELEALIDHDAYNANNSSTPLPEGSADFRGTVPAPGSEGGWQIRRGLTQMQQQQAGGPGDDVDMDGDAPDADIVLIEQFGWQQVVAWYGPVRPPSGLPRSVISKDDGILQIELNPPTFVLFQARPSDSTQVANGSVQSAPLRLSLSADALVTELHDAARSALGVTAGSSRLWHIRKSLRELADAQAQAQAQASTSRSLQRSIPTHLLTVLEANHLDTYSDATRSQGLLRDAEIESGDSFALELPSTTSSGEAVWSLQINERGLAMEVAAPDVDMATSAPKPLFSQPAMFPGSPSATAQNGGVVTRSKATTTEGKGKTPGLRGLTNLGNTCFMNSGLQCLSNTPELSQYFHSGAYTSEVNRANPLGMNGQVAEQFGALVEQIWDPNGSSSSNSYFSSNAVTPRQFKSMIGRYNSSFAGYGQQDTQELIAFLLDGLHEDLNRIHKKPYIEKPDWKDGGKEAELALFAQECWEGYKKRNDSAIVDLFQGQLKSTLVCPDCHRKSITLDPFMYLTLPIPVKKYDSRVFYIVPLDPRKQRMQVNASFTTNASLAQVKRKLANLVDIPAANLLATDQYKNNVWAYFSDDAAISQCGAQDVVVLHELPFAVTQSNDKAAPAVKDDTRNVIAVPVYSLAQERNHNADARTFLEPFYIELTRSQAKDEVAIKRKVAERYAELVDVERQDDFWQRFEEAPQQQEAEEATESRPASPAPTTPSPFDLTFAAADTSDREKTSHSFSFGRSSFFKGTSLRRLSAAETRAQRKGLFNRAEKMVKSFGSGSRSSSDDEEALVDWKDAIFPVWDMATAQEFFGRDLEGRYRASDNMWVQVTDPAILERAKSARDPRRIALADCLDDFEREETLGENDLWYCSQCKKHQAATKKMEIYQVPDILVICLKRFSQAGYSRRKIDEKVDFPIEGLDLEDRVDERRIARVLSLAGEDLTKYGIRNVDEPLMYDLYAVDNHYGGLGGGHYTATCKNAVDGKWYKFDDSHVSPAGEGDIKSSAAYLLFYRRRTARPIGGKTREKTEAGLRSRNASSTSLPGLVTAPSVVAHEPSRLSQSMTLPPAAPRTVAASGAQEGSSLSALKPTSATSLGSGGDGFTSDTDEIRSAASSSSSSASTSSSTGGGDDFVRMIDTAPATPRRRQGRIDDDDEGWSPVEYSEPEHGARVDASSRRLRRGGGGDDDDIESEYGDEKAPFEDAREEEEEEEGVAAAPLPPPPPLAAPTAAIDWASLGKSSSSSAAVAAAAPPSR